MVRHFANLRFPASTVAALVALAIVMFAGSAQAHEWAPHDDAATQVTAVATNSTLCAMGAGNCDGETAGSSMPCSGMSSGHCSQAGVPTTLAAFAGAATLSANINPLVDHLGSGVFAPVDTPPPRA